MPLRVGVKDPELMAFGQREKAHFTTELHQSLHWTVQKPIGGEQYGLFCKSMLLVGSLWLF